MRESESNDAGDSSVLSEYSSSIVGGLKSHPILLVGVALLAVFVWVFRPYFQPIWYFIRFTGVTFLMYASLSAIAGLGAKFAFRSDKKIVGYVLMMALVVCLALTLVGPYVAGIETNEDLSAETTTNSIVINETQNATEIDTENARILTLKGADTQADTSFNEPTHRLSRGELVMRNGQLSTSKAVVPEGLYKSLTRNQKGAVFTNINSNKPSVEQVDQQFKCGRGMLIFDDVHFKIQKDNMNTNLVNPTTFEGNDGNLYNMYSGVQHDLRFGIDHGVPVIYGVPEMTGVYLSDTDCNQEFLTPEEAVNDSRMDGANQQQFYPYDLMQKEVMATNLQNGWINTVTDKNGMKELPDTPSIDNRPPYTLISEDGKYMQVLTMEAIGEGTGVFEVYVGDGRTGEKTKYQFNKTTKGPGYAVDATITANSERFGQGGDKLTISEVYPVFRDGELWYQVNAVQRGTGVYGFTGFYNPESGTLLKAYNDEQISAFYDGSDATNTREENVVETGTTSSNGRTVDDPTLWVVITDEETGETHTVPIGSGESLEVSQDSPDNSTATDN